MNPIPESLFLGLRSEVKCCLPVLKVSVEGCCHTRLSLAQLSRRTFCQRSLSSASVWRWAWCCQLCCCWSLQPPSSLPGPCPSLALESWELILARLDLGEHRVILVNWVQQTVSCASVAWSRLSDCWRSAPGWGESLWTRRAGAGHSSQVCSEDSGAWEHISSSSEVEWGSGEDQSPSSSWEWHTPSYFTSLLLNDNNIWNRVNLINHIKQEQ